MPDITMYTNEAAIEEAAAVQGDLALSKLRFFDNTIIPDVTTTQAQLVAAETALVGYPVGGYPLTAWGAPLLVPAGGAVITSPLTHVAYASGVGVVIGGGWVETATGEIRFIFVFDPVRSLANIGDGFEFLRQILYGRNP